MQNKILLTLALFIVIKLSAQKELKSINQATPTAYSSGKGNFAFYGSASLTWAMSYGLGKTTTIHAGNYLPVSAKYYPLWTGLSIKQEIASTNSFRLSILGGGLSSFRIDKNYTNAYYTSILTAFGNENSFISFQTGIVKYKKKTTIPEAFFPYLSIGGKAKLSNKWSLTGNLFLGLHDNDFGESGGDYQSYVYEGGGSININFRRDWKHASLYLGIITAAIDANSDFPPIYPNIGYSFGL